MLASADLVAVGQQLDDWESLVQVYQVELEALQDPTERIVLRRKIARLYEAKGDDPRSALRAYAAAFADNPSDQGVLEQLQRLAAALGVWAELVAAFEAGLQKLERRRDEGQPAPPDRPHAGPAAGRLPRRGDGLRAAAQAQRPTSRRSTGSMPLTLLAEVESADEVLDLRADMVGDPAQQKAVRQRQRDSSRSSSDAWTMRSKSSSQGARSGRDGPELHQLIAGLFERRERWGELVELLERRLTVLTDPAGRRETLAAWRGRSATGCRTTARRSRAGARCSRRPPATARRSTRWSSCWRPTRPGYDLVEVLQRKLEAAADDTERLALRAAPGAPRPGAARGPDRGDRALRAGAGPGAGHRRGGDRVAGDRGDEEHRFRVFEIPSPPCGIAAAGGRTCWSCASCG